MPLATPFLSASLSPCPASSWERGLGAAILALISEILVGTVMVGNEILQPVKKAMMIVAATVFDTCILQR